MQRRSILVRNEESIRTRTDFSLFHDCFNGRISPTDIDMAVEKDSGRFLFVEFKHPEAFIDTGQRIFLDRLSEIPRVTVAVVWGEVDLSVSKPFVCYMRHWGIETERRKTDINGFREFLRRWSNREWE